MAYDLMSVLDERRENIQRATAGEPPIICRRRNGVNGRPLVSVGVTCYNQRDFIAYAIESILKQVVDFTYELVIADDCSTDGTREIVQKYAQEFPETVRLILQEKNVGVRKQSLDLKESCRGVFRAHLEGDDYWTKDQTLKSLIDFLETHEEYIAVAGRVAIVDELNKITKFPYADIKNTYKMDGDYTLEDFENWLLPSHTGSLVYRNFYYQCGSSWLERYEDTFLPGDRKTALYLVLHGKIRILDTTVSARRILLNSEENFTATMKRLYPYSLVFDWMTEAEQYASKLYDTELDLSASKDKQFAYAVRRGLRNPNSSSLAQIEALKGRMGNPSRQYKLVGALTVDMFKSRVKRKGLSNTIKFVLKTALKKISKIKKSKKDVPGIGIANRDAKVLFGKHASPMTHKTDELTV
jgi:glycosyltransferase involved in cell wall biosynthesis